MFKDNEILQKLNKIEERLDEIEDWLAGTKVYLEKVHLRLAELDGKLDALTTAVSEAAERVVSEQKNAAMKDILKQKDAAMREILEEVAKLKAERELFEAYRITIQDYARFREQVEGELVKLRSELQGLKEEGP